MTLKISDDFESHGLRIEALQAAARVSGAVVRETSERHETEPNHQQVTEYTLAIADLFYRWLETGKRE